MSVSATLCHDPVRTDAARTGHVIMVMARRVKLVEQLCQRLRVPNEIRDLARLVAEFHDLIHTFQC